MRGLTGRVAAATVDDRRIGLSRGDTDAALLTAWGRAAGRPAGIRDLLRDLDLRARPARLRWTRTAAAFGWDEPDARTRSWVPQGVTTSADAFPDGTVHGREVVAAGWYRRTESGPDQAARVTFVDVTDPGDVRYRHVLLAEPAWGDAGRPVTRPVPVHAGGIVWYGDLLYVAGTYGGLRVFDLADLVRVDPAQEGCSYVLPQRWTYAPAYDRQAWLRFSFASLDRTSQPPSLLAGEYSRGGRAARVARFPLDPVTGLLDQAGEAAEPVHTFALGLARMQGIACVRGTYYVSSSNGRYGRGHLWVGDPRRGFRPHRWALPAGPEDLGVQWARGLLWSLTEWPGRRAMFALRASDWAPPR
jgi:hypothetical protein